MRHGWKTRIEERKYFEEKKQMREEKVVLLNMVRRKMEAEYQLHMQELKENHEIN